MDPQLPPPSNLAAAQPPAADLSSASFPVTAPPGVSPICTVPTAGLSLERMPAKRCENLDALLNQMPAWDASDIHFQDGEIQVRIAGELRRIDYSMDDLSLRMAVAGLLREEQRREFGSRHYLDFAIQSADGKSRFRANAFEHEGGIALAVRLIPSNPPAIEGLQMLQSVRDVLVDLSARPRGLILVAGSTGSGKSTTLAAMIGQILTGGVNVITLEQPPEFDLTKTAGRVGSIKQIEVGRHVASFAEGIRNAMRQNPNVIMIGEMRDVAEVDAALDAAETGHLVIATVHSKGVVSAIERITGMYKDERLNKVSLQLSQVLQGVVFQSLVRLAENPDKRMAACEVMLAHPGISNQIRDGKTHMIAGTIQTQKAMGMVLLDDQLTALVKTGKIAAEEALRVANQPDEIKKQLNIPLRLAV